ncbi:MAG: hypothetical protein NTZ18_02345 [Candidatus Komeilibacteria bacterium]|nr:hypothetical protein [Candidatus Komeilibacteria bacterium]
MNKLNKLIVLAIAVFGVFLLAGSAQAATYLNVALNHNVPEGHQVYLTDENDILVNLDFTNSATSTEPISLSTLYIGTTGVDSLFFSRFMLFAGDRQIAATSVKSGRSLVFNNLNYVLQVGETKTLTVKGNVNRLLKSNYTNRIGVTSGALIFARGTRDHRLSTVSGNFPIVGNTFNLVIPRSYGVVINANEGHEGGVVSLSRGATNFNLLTLAITNEEREGQPGSDMMLDSIKLTNTGSSGANTVFSSIGLYDGDRLIARGTKLRNTYSFTNLRINLRTGINVGETKNLTVKVNIARNAQVDSTIILGIHTSLDLRGHNVGVNGANLPTIFIADNVRSLEYTIIGEGRLAASAESNPATTNVVAGMAEVPMLKVKFTAANGAFNVNRLRIAQTNADLFDRSVQSVTIAYQNQAGQTITSTQNLNNGNADFNISANPAYIPVNASGLVSVLANLNPINQNFAAFTGDSIEFTFRTAQGFEARGVGNNYIVQNVGNRDISGNDMVVHGTVPTVKADASQGNLANGPVDLYRFKVSAAEGTDLSLKKVSFKLNLNDTVINEANLNLRNFEILEGSSYNNASALTQGDSGADSYQIYNGWGATNVVANGEEGGKLSNVNGYMDAREGANQDVIVAFNDDRLISAGQSKYYILRAIAGNVDTGVDSNDAVSTYMYDGDTSITAYKGLEASCDVNGAAGQGSKYCLSSDGRANDIAAYFIWSDNTGVNGNNAHQDVNSDGSYDGQAVTPSTDWFNGWKIKTLGVQRVLN